MKPQKPTKVRRRLIMPGIYDEPLRGRFKGRIHDLAMKGDQTVVTVYGDTMEEMRELKHHLTACVREFYESKREKD